MSNGFRFGIFYTIIRPEEKAILAAAEARGLVVDRLADDEVTFGLERPSDLPDVVESIAVALRYSYLLGYQVPDTGAPHPKNWNGRHIISIKLVPSEKYAGYIVIAKSGYFEGYR